MNSIPFLFPVVLYYISVVVVVAAVAVVVVLLWGVVVVDGVGLTVTLVMCVGNTVVVWDCWCWCWFWCGDVIVVAAAVVGVV